MRQKSFTLVELLIVVTILAILASAVIVVINPRQRFAQVRDSTREQHLQSLQTALYSYQTDHGGFFVDISLPATPTEICNTDKVNPSECGSLVNLSPLVPGYLSNLPVDPRGGIDSKGTGYFVALINDAISLSAPKAETRTITLGPQP